MTVLSVNSMVSGGVYSLGLLALGPLAEHTSVSTAILVAGAFSLLGIFCYRPALKEERVHPDEFTEAIVTERAVP